MFSTAAKYCGLSLLEFRNQLADANQEILIRKRKWEPLIKATTVQIYSYGTRGKDLAYQLRSKGVNCLIFDNSQSSVESAVRDGFSVINTINPDIPTIVGAGQNQIEIMNAVSHDIYSLAESLYALNLRNSYGIATKFSKFVMEEQDSLFSIYQMLDIDSRVQFLEVLKYRASLNVRHLTHRRPLKEMWNPKLAGLTIRSFCDIGAFDGDSLEATKIAFPELSKSFTIEPSAALGKCIELVAKRIGVDNRNYVGACWSHKATLELLSDANSMMVVHENSLGNIPSMCLDDLLGNNVYDYIKMDVEGSEDRVIRGGHRSLNNAKIIAAAAYHKPEDLLEIPNLIAEVTHRNDKSWRLHFAHYSQVFDDSIYYFEKL
jgi:FkbM family methyltransferase